MQKQNVKASRKNQRIEEERRRDRRMKLIFWGTGIVFIAAIVLAIVFQPKAKGLSVDYSLMPRLGQAEAPVKIVEFGDYKCPSCKVFAEQIKPQLQKDYIDTGKASLYFANFMIISPNADSRTAALAGQAAFHQNNDAFWKFYEAVYKNQKDEREIWATTDNLAQIAQQENVPLDLDKLKADVDGAKYASEVDKQYGWATKGRFTGTPTLLINGQKFTDVFDYNKVKAAIDGALKDAG